MQKEKLDFKAIEDLINNDLIPKDINGKATLIRGLVSLNMLGPNHVGRIIAQARMENFNDEEPAWAKWVTETFEYSKEHRCHLNLVGKLLIGMKEKYPECYERLIELEYDKNLSIARLYRGNGGHDVQRFLAAHVEKMSRDEVRDAVELCLNPGCETKPKAPAKVEQPNIPGLIENIDTICKFDIEEFRGMHKNPDFTPAKAGKSILVGVELLTAGIGQLELKNMRLQTSTESIESLKVRTYQAFKKLESWTNIKPENLDTAG